MKKRTTNKLVMFQSVRTVLNDYQSEWQGLPVFVQVVSELDSKTTSLRSLLTQQMSLTTGVTESKNQRILLLREELLLMQRALYLLGKATNNVLLKARNKQTKTELFSLNIAQLTVRCNEMKIDLENEGANLAAYGIQPTAVTAILDEINQLNEVQNSSRIAVLKRKSVTTEILETERSLSSLLKDELDTLVLVFKRSNAAFYQAYMNARSVPQIGKSPDANDERDDGSQS